MLSGDLARAYEKEYGVSNEAARQALSRARPPVRKIKGISFEKNQKFFYLEKQFMSQRYLDGLLQAIKSSLREYWSYIRAFDAQSGFVSKESFPAMVPSPIQNVRNHKLHQRVIDDLLRHRIIEEYNETCWKLCEWVPVSNENFARSRGLETAKKQVVRDFASWAGRINLIGYHSAKMFTASAEFAHFQWALTAPSYVQPLYDDKRKKPGFLVADIFYGRTADLEDIQRSDREHLRLEVYRTAFGNRQRFYKFQCDHRKGSGENRGPVQRDIEIRRTLQRYDRGYV